MNRKTNFFHLIAQSPIGTFYRIMSAPYPNIILAYHGVQKEQHPRCIRTDLFLEHMKFIRNTWHIIQINDLVRDLPFSARSPCIAVTFDDGYSNLIEEAIPILVEMNIPATIYVPFEFVGKRNEWDRNRAESMLPILSRDDLQSIIKGTNNITVGSHGVRHSRLSDLPHEDLQNEIIGSKKGLEDMLGIPIESIAYPYGGRLDYDERVLDTVAKSGYHFGLSGRYGRYNREEEKWHMRRLVIWRDDNLGRFKAKLQGKYDWICIKERIAFRLRSPFKGLQK